MFAIHRILVPVDFSEPSSVALDHAVSLARRHDATVDVVHVWEPPVSLTSEMSTESTRMESTALVQAAVEVRRITERHTAAGFDRFGVRLETGRPAEVIVRLAETGGYDLVVMGTRGRTGLAHLLLGSVAERVVRACLCPVLTVRGETPAAPAEPKPHKAAPPIL